MLATDDCYAYWRHVDPATPPSGRASEAFAARWFGTKSEARVRTIMTDMLERFDAFPEALALLRSLGSVPARLRPLICHLHTQLADPVYRRFTGELLPARHAAGLRTIDRAAAARWVDELEPGRWSANTCLKFGSNLLATAFEAGLVGGRRDPRKIDAPQVPAEIVGYALYLLRGVEVEGTLTANPYLRSLVGGVPLVTVLAHVPGIRFAAIGDVGDLTFLEPSLQAYGVAHLRPAS
jgi:hypothetical protein